MSPDLLREAAALMRERAEAATEDWWLAAEFPLIAPLMGKADAAHIASWHPAVALAVADWLDACANSYHPNFASLRHEPAFAVARTYLNDNTDTTRGN